MDCKIKLFLVTIFMIIGTRFGYCKGEFIEIYSDDETVISIYPFNEMEEYEGNPCFIFRREFITPERREAVKRACRLDTDPYIEATVVTYDANWEQSKIICIGFYNKDNEEIDSIWSDSFSWNDIKSKIEILKRDRALLLYKIWQEEE